MARIAVFKVEDIDRDIDPNNGKPLYTGRLKANKAPVQECEQCRRWLLKSEYPTSLNTWVCKVCQGLKNDSSLTQVKEDVGYADYLMALKTLETELAEYREESRAKIAEFKERRRALVASQYAKYEKS